MLSKDLEATLSEAFRSARKKRHEFMTVEHLLLSLLDNEVIFKEDVERILGARPFASAAPALAEPVADPATVSEKQIADATESAESSDSGEAPDNAPESPKEDA